MNLNLRPETHIKFWYDDINKKQKVERVGKIRSLTKHEDAYIVFFIEENEPYINEQKNNRKMYHNYLVNEDNFIKEYL